VALVSGTIFSQSQMNQEGVQNITGALFIFIVNGSFGAFFASLAVRFIINSTKMLMSIHQYCVLPFKRHSQKNIKFS
jgi:hypothetical protein